MPEDRRLTARSLDSDGQTPWGRDFFGVDKYALWGNFNKNK